MYLLNLKPDTLMIGVVVVILCYMWILYFCFVGCLMSYWQAVTQ